MLKVRGLDHIVLTVADIERSLAWYGGKLGLEPLRVEEWRRGEVFFPSLRIDEGTIIDLFPGQPEPVQQKNLDHLCLVIDPADLNALEGFEVVDGPGARWGARGDGTSVYVKDPDGNTVELRYYQQV